MTIEEIRSYKYGGKTTTIIAADEYYSLDKPSPLHQTPKLSLSLSSYTKYIVLYFQNIGYAFTSLEMLL